MTGSQPRLIDWKLRVLATLVAIVAGGAFSGSTGATFAALVVWNAFYLFGSHERPRAGIFNVALYGIALGALMYAAVNEYYTALVVLALITVTAGFVLHKFMGSAA